jgi:hypothetical protein
MEVGKVSGLYSEPRRRNVGMHAVKSVQDSKHQPVHLTSTSIQFTISSSKTAQAPPAYTWFSSLEG